MIINTEWLEHNIYQQHTGQWRSPRTVHGIDAEDSVAQREAVPRRAFPPGRAALPGQQAPPRRQGILGRHSRGKQEWCCMSIKKWKTCILKKNVRSNTIWI